MMARGGGKMKFHNCAGEGYKNVLCKDCYLHELIIVQTLVKPEEIQISIWKG